MSTETNAISRSSTGTTRRIACLAWSLGLVVVLGCQRSRHASEPPTAVSEAPEQERADSSSTSNDDEREGPTRKASDDEDESSGAAVRRGKVREEDGTASEESTSETSDASNSPARAFVASRAQFSSAVEEARDVVDVTFPPRLTDSVVRRLAAGEAHVEQFVASGPEMACRERLIEPAIEVRFHVESGSYDDRHGKYRFENCHTLLKRLREASETRHIGAGPWRLDVEATTVELGERTLFEMPCADTFMCGSDMNNWSVEFYSMVGPILSFSSGSSSAEAGGPPYPGRQGFAALDLRDGSRASPAALFPDDTFWSSLLETGWMKNQLSEKAREAIDSVQDLNEALREASKEPYLYDSYYFAEWHAESGEAEIHVEMTRDEGPGRLDSPDRIELRLKPTPKYRKYFEVAAEGRGFYRSSDHRPKTWTLEPVYHEDDW